MAQACDFGQVVIGGGFAGLSRPGRWRALVQAGRHRPSSWTASPRMRRTYGATRWSANQTRDRMPHRTAWLMKKQADR